MARAPFVVPALKKHTATVIMAHGLGDSGQGWLSFANNWRRRGLFEEVSFIFPNAPSIPITVNFGMHMPGWYDIAKLGRDLDSEENVRTQDEVGILRSREYFNKLIKEEMDKGIKSSRIILGGFSQGGAMSVFTGLTSEQKLGGVFGLSCYLLLADRIENFLPKDWVNKETPFFLAHGQDDDVVQLSYGQKSVNKLREMKLENLEFKEYRNLGHSADTQEIADLEQFLVKSLKEDASAGAESVEDASASL